MGDSRVLIHNISSKHQRGLLTSSRKTLLVVPRDGGNLIFLTTGEELEVVSEEEELKIMNGS